MKEGVKWITTYFLILNLGGIIVPRRVHSSINDILHKLDKILPTIFSVPVCIRYLKVKIVWHSTPNQSTKSTDGNDF